MRPFSTTNIVNAVISGIAGAVVTIVGQPLVASAIQPGAGSDLSSAIPVPLQSVSESFTVVESGKHHRVYQLAEGELVFQVLILTQELRWEMDSADAVVDPGGQPHSVSKYLKTHLGHLLAKAKDVVSIGMASCEGSKIRNEELAGNRAEMLKLWAQQGRPDDRQRNYYVVNLGQFKGHQCEDGPYSAGDTSRQRRVVILYVIEKGDLDTETLTAGIRRQLRPHKELLFDPADYSLNFLMQGGRDQFAS